MNMIDQAFGVHEQALALRSQRMEVLARNIANADTPHFKAKDITFICLETGTYSLSLWMKRQEITPA